MLHSVCWSIGAEPGGWALGAAAPPIFSVADSGGGGAGGLGPPFSQRTR